MKDRSYGFEPTEEQVLAADLFVAGSPLKINAYAGTGKTTTLEYLAGFHKGRGLYLAFNNVIAKEARRRFPRNTECMTIHALASRGLPADLQAKLAKDRVLPQEQLRDYLVRRCGIRDREANVYADAVSQSLRTFYRSKDVEPGDLHIADVAHTNLIDIEPDVLIRATNSCWASMASPGGELPLSHGAYLKWFYLFGRIEGYDFIVVDEAQDLGPITVGVVRNADLQTVWVGDRYQAIYDWNGAENALDTIEGLKEVSLTKSFRIGERRAELVSALLVDLGEFSPIVGNPAVKTVIGMGHQTVRIVRNNATLLAKLLHLTKRKRVFVLSGTARLEKLCTDADLLMRGKRVRTGPLSEFSSWDEVRERGACRFGHPYKEFADAIDGIGCEKARQIIRNLPISANEADVILTTVHGAKGREFGAVSIYDDFRGKKLNGRFFKTMPAPITRLLYVAVTRAKETLFMERSLSKRFNLVHLEFAEQKEASSTASLQQTQVTGSSGVSNIKQ